jgi:NADH-quinone oxidoreductase subunit J
LTAEVVLFWAFSVVAVGAAIAMVTMRNLVHAALMLVVNLLAVAGLFLVLQTPFLAAIQIIVYGGAIMILFLFVIMLLGVRRDDLLIARARAVRIGAWSVAALFAVVVAIVLAEPYMSDASICGPGIDAAGGAVRCVGLDEVFEDPDGSVAFVARTLFTRYVFAFEFIALLLVVATIAALVIGRRSDLRQVPGGLPGGVDAPSTSDLGDDGLAAPVGTPHGHVPGGADGAGDRGPAAPPPREGDA